MALPAIPNLKLHSCAFRVIPTPRSLSDSRAILRLLQRIGEVSAYKWFKYHPRLGGTNSGLVVFRDQKSAEEAMTRSPMYFWLVDEPKRTDQYGLLVPGAALRPGVRAVLEGEDDPVLRSWEAREERRETAASRARMAGSKPKDKSDSEDVGIKRAVAAALGKLRPGLESIHLRTQATSSRSSRTPQYDTEASTRTNKDHATRSQIVGADDDQSYPRDLARRPSRSWTEVPQEEAQETMARPYERAKIERPETDYDRGRTSHRIMRLDLKKSELDMSPEKTTRPIIRPQDAEELERLSRRGRVNTELPRDNIMESMTQREETVEPARPETTSSPQKLSTVVVLGEDELAAFADTVVNKKSKSKRPTDRKLPPSGDVWGDEPQTSDGSRNSTNPTSSKSPRNQPFFSPSRCYSTSQTPEADPTTTTAPRQFKLVLEPWRGNQKEDITRSKFYNSFVYTGTDPMQIDLAKKVPFNGLSEVKMYNHQDMMNYQLGFWERQMEGLPTLRDWVRQKQGLKMRPQVYQWLQGRSRG